jgi:hypothetical protein
LIKQIIKNIVNSQYLGGESSTEIVHSEEEMAAHGGKGM